MGEEEAKPVRAAWAAEVGGLAEMVQYQKGSIVSRSLVSKKTGTITLFAFDKDQALSEHTAPYDALVHVLDGMAEITISGKPFSVRQGEGILMPAGEPHALKAIKSFKMILTMIKSE